MEKCAKAFARQARKILGQSGRGFFVLNALEALSGGFIHLLQATLYLLAGRFEIGLELLLA